MHQCLFAERLLWVFLWRSWPHHLLWCRIISIKERAKILELLPDSAFEVCHYHLHCLDYAVFCWCASQMPYEFRTCHHIATLLFDHQRTHCSIIQDELAISFLSILQQARSNCLSCRFKLGAFQRIDCPRNGSCVTRRREAENMTYILLRWAPQQSQSLSFGSFSTSQSSGKQVGTLWQPPCLAVSSLDQCN